MRPLRIVSLQSHVVDGTVGNAAAVFPMQRMGAEVLPVHTVQFSNHPAAGPVGGDILPAEHLARVLAGLTARGLPARLDAVLSGYLGAAETADVLAGWIGDCRAVQPSMPYACDPVIGDSGKGVYVRPDLAATIRDRLIPLASIAFPNLFELQWLTGLAVESEVGLAAAIAALHRMGPRAVVVTSVEGLDGAGTTGLAISTGGAVTRIHQPKLDRSFSGAGDCFAGMCLVHILRSGDVVAAARLAGAAIHALLALTMAEGRDKLALVTGQHLIGA